MTLPNVQSRVFYSYMILINNKEVGTLQEFSPSARKTVERVREISYTQKTKVIEIVPGIVDFSVTVSKIMLFKEDLFKALGYVVDSIEDLRDPFEILEECMKPDGNKEQTIYHGCQFESYDYSISTRETIITERASIAVAFVTKRTV